MDKETKAIIKNAGGEVIKVIQMYGEVSDEVTLDNLKEQAGDISKFDTLVLEIASPGGSVSEGLDIMVWLDSLSVEGKQIVTVVTANSYSIASLIMLVADIKLISNSAKVMVHNPMVPLLEYVNANDLQQYIHNLRQLENTMYELYEFFTGLNKEQIKMLMDNETYLEPSEAVEYGFADMVVDIKPKSYEMTANNKNEINMSKTLNILNKVIGMMNKSEFINQIYSDLEGQEIEIFQMNPANYSVGDRTSMEEGEVVLSDGSKLTIAEGKISEIGRSAEVAKETPAMDETKAAEFNEGPAPKSVVEKMIKDDSEAIKDDSKMIKDDSEAIKDDSKAIKDDSKMIKDDSKMIKDDSEAIKDDEKMIKDDEKMIKDDEKMIKDDEKMIKDDEKMIKDGEEMIKDGEKMEQDGSEKMEQDGSEKMKVIEVTQEHMDAMHATMDSLSQRIAALEEMCGGYAARFEALNKFENIATEAIDTLATNTVSTFKPEARVTSVPASTGGSIFNQLKNKRGLK